MNTQIADFIKSAVRPEDFPASDSPSVVFAGKSNVGKSSVINRLLNRKNFARVGAEPGKTIHVNYFRIDHKVYFVDLPGYGYAKVSKNERDRWGRLMESFFEVPERISLGIFIVDSRHKPTADDCTMAQWFLGTGRPFVIVANKVDKLKKSEIQQNLSLIEQTLVPEKQAEVIPFSAEKGTGREVLLAMIESAVSGVQGKPDTGADLSAAVKTEPGNKS